MNTPKYLTWFALAIYVFLIFLIIGNAQAKCVSPSEATNAQNWHYTDRPILSKYIQTTQFASVIAYQKHTSHALEMEMEGGCWTGRVQIMSIAAFRYLVGVKAFDAFQNGEEI